MFRTVSFVFVVLVTLASCAPHSPSMLNKSVVGDITSSQLLTDYPKFFQSYERYQVRFNELPSKDAMINTEFVVLLGTWCHDSVREVPRLIKILEALEVPEERLTLIGLDFSKSEPLERQQLYGLTRTPTIVVLRDGVEIGRVTERPSGSLESDLARIVSM